MRLLRESAGGLLDQALPTADQQVIGTILARYRAQGVEFHALRTRGAGQRRFLSLHVLVPGTWTIQRGHDLVEHLEADLRADLPGVTVFTHLEPAEDPVAFADQELDRPAPRAAQEEQTPAGSRPGGAADSQ